MFELLKNEDYDLLLPFFERHNYLHCEYSLASAIVWNKCTYEVYKQINNGILLLMEKDLHESHQRRLMMPLPAGQKKITPEELCIISKENENIPFHYVPQNYYDENKKEIDKYFDSENASGFTDYVYKTEDMAKLAGHKYSKKRNLISQFKKLTCELRDVKTETINKDNAPECFKMLEHWHPDNDTGVNLDILNCEKKAILNSLSLFDKLQMLGIMIRIDGEISAFAIGSFLNENTFVLNFEKADENIKGLYQYLDEQFANIIPPKYIFLNKESDLNKLGLAKSKESYHPFAKIKSYILKPKP